MFWFWRAAAKSEKAAQIHVGVVQAQTGMYAAFGQGGVFGIKAAVEDINKQGGVKVGDNKMQIKLTVVDSESDPNKAGSLAESLIVQDKVELYRHRRSNRLPCTPGVSQAADRYKIPYVTSVGPDEPWMGDEAGNADQMAVHLGDGQFRHRDSLQGRRLPGKAGLHHHRYLDGHARSLRQRRPTRKSASSAPTNRTEGAGIPSSDPPSRKRATTSSDWIRTSVSCPWRQPTSLPSSSSGKTPRCGYPLGQLPRTVLRRCLETGQHAGLQAEDGLHRKRRLVL